MDFEVPSLGSGDLEDDDDLDGPMTSLMVEESRENGELLEEVSSLSFPTDPSESMSMSWSLKCRWPWWSPNPCSNPLDGSKSLRLIDMSKRESCRGRKAPSR